MTIVPEIKKKEKAILMYVRINQPYTPVTCGNCGAVGKLNPRNVEISSRSIPPTYICGECGTVGKTDIDY